MLVVSGIGVAGVVNGGTVAELHVLVRFEDPRGFLEWMKQLERGLDPESQNGRQDDEGDSPSLLNSEHHQ
jgi:hypothetical protein